MKREQWFEYHCYEGEDSVDAELWHHTHQQVVVLYRLTNTDEEEIGRMYRVRFADGFEYDVFEDELVNSPQGFYRLDYSVGASPTLPGAKCLTPETVGFSQGGENEIHTDTVGQHQGQRNG